MYINNSNKKNYKTEYSLIFLFNEKYTKKTKNTNVTEKNVSKL